MTQEFSPEIPLSYKIFKNALVAPSSSKTVYRNIDGAVFDSDLQPIKESLLTRSWTPPQISFPPDISNVNLKNIEVIEDAYIYGGYFFNHFGHFLLESLARTWVIEEVGQMPFVWASGDPPNSWQSEILRLIGVTSSQFFPGKPTLFRRLIIPDPGYRIQTFFHPTHAEFLACWDNTEPLYKPPTRVWLSRKNIKHPWRRSRGEDRLQNILSKMGWQIFHPQSVNVNKQLKIMSGAEVVAGLEGSAFHLNILLKNPSTKFIVLRRSKRSPNYQTIASRKGIDEFDLYGAYSIDRRVRYPRLHRPGKWGMIVNELAEKIRKFQEDDEKLEALKEQYETKYNFEDWHQIQSRRWIAHGLATGREFIRKVGIKVRRRLPDKIKRFMPE